MLLTLTVGSLPKGLNSFTSKTSDTVTVSFFAYSSRIKISPPPTPFAVKLTRTKGGGTVSSVVSPVPPVFQNAQVDPYSSVDE